MIQQKLSSITLILSLAGFLTVSAFTFAPGQAETGSAAEPAPVEMQSPACHTCTFGDGGRPDGCTGAEFCGLRECIGSCDMYGMLCGECAHM